MTEIMTLNTQRAHSVCVVIYLCREQTTEMRRYLQQCLIDITPSSHNNHCWAYVVYGNSYKCLILMSDCINAFTY